MFCPKCGDKVEPNEMYCNKCGNRLSNNTSVIPTNYSNNVSPVPQNQIYNYQPSIPNNLKNNNKKMILIGIGAGILVLLFIFTFIINITKGKYYFSNNSYENSGEIQDNNTTKTPQKKGKYSTAIICDNRYSGVKVQNNADAYKLISDDSTSQKNNCPSDIKVVEDKIINDYGITAVNLCEMDVGFAREIGNVIKKIYEEYPSVRGYLTNLSLINASMSEGYIAAFMPMFYFATSDTSSTYPWIIKTQILLNTSYFLNAERLQASVTGSSNAGHFPPNATIYSPVSHELGHYLSFLAMMNNYDVNSILLVDNNNSDAFYKLHSDFAEGQFSLQMINEAFDKYKKDTNTTMTVDEWRGTISKYALAKDNSGNYIYDETIAEAFHDVYLNGDNAKDASKYVVQVLKNKLEG